MAPSLVDGSLPEAQRCHHKGLSSWLLALCTWWSFFWWGFGIRKLALLQTSQRHCYIELLFRVAFLLLGYTCWIFEKLCLLWCAVIVSMSASSTDDSDQLINMHIYVKSFGVSEMRKTKYHKIILIMDNEYKQTLGNWICRLKIVGTHSTVTLSLKHHLKIGNH